MLYHGEIYGNYLLFSVEFVSIHFSYMRHEIHSFHRRKRGSRPIVSIGSKTLSQGERNHHMPAYYHDFLQRRTEGMNENIQQGRDLTKGLNTHPRREASSTSAARR